MVNYGPHTAGSQFFIALVPNPAMDGRFTVFGRVLRGQDVIDHITPGRTNKSIGRGGKIIPGDLLVRAEVIRKQPGRGKKP
jgi:cyclophilin family peptidyl-prolyl cis-trans isomerase